MRRVVVGRRLKYPELFEFSVRFFFFIFTILSWILNLNLCPISGNCSLGIKYRWHLGLVCRAGRKRAKASRQWEKMGIKLRKPGKLPAVIFEEHKPDHMNLKFLLQYSLFSTQLLFCCLFSLGALGCTEGIISSDYQPLGSCAAQKFL